MSVDNSTSISGGNDESPASFDDSAVYYTSVPHREGKLMAYSIGGVLALLIAIGGFFIRVFVAPGKSELSGQLSLHFQTTMPAMMGIFSLSHAWQLFRAPWQISLTADGVRIIGRSEVHIPWTDIGNVSMDEASVLGARTVRLRDAQDRNLAVISCITEADQLVEQLKQRVRCPNHESADTGQSLKATAVHRKRGRKRAIGFGTFAAFMLMAAIFIVSEGRWQAYQQQAIQSRAVDGTGIVVDHLVAPNGITKRLYVKVTGSNGTEETHNFEISDEVFAATQTGQHVSIRYVPDDPRIAELHEGQIFETDILKTPLGSYVMGSIGILMSLGMLAAAILAWKGYDIKWDDKHRGLVPIGE